MDRDPKIRWLNRKNVGKRESGISQISEYLLFKIASIVIFSLVLYFVYNSIKITLQKVDILRKAEKEVQDLRLENLHLSVGIEEISSDEYLEKAARDRLNFGGEGEVVFVIPDTILKMAEEEVEEIITPKAEPIHKKGGNIDEWISFILNGV